MPFVGKYLEAHGNYNPSISGTYTPIRTILGDSAGSVGCFSNIQLQLSYTCQEPASVDWMVAAVVVAW